MTLAFQGNRDVYEGDAATTEFDFSFWVEDATHLSVLLVDETTLAVTEQVLTTHYSVTGVGTKTGGTVTFVTPPTGNQLVVIEGNPSLAQSVDISTVGAFRAQAFEDALDRCVRAVARAFDAPKRALKLGPQFVEYTDAGAYWDTQGLNILSTATPTRDDHLATKIYVDTEIIDYTAIVTALRDQAAASAAEADADRIAAAASAAAAAASAATAAAAQAAVEDFDSRYLGASASAPTEDLFGNPLQTGDLYFDTVGGAMKYWTGSAWDVAYAPTGAYVALAGGTMTGALVLSGAPTIDLHAATKKYVDDSITALDATEMSLDGSEAMTGKLTTVAPDGTKASIRLPAGTTPAAPAIGDIWYEGGFVMKIESTTGAIQFCFNTIDNDWQQSQTFNGANITMAHASAEIILSGGTAPVIRFSGSSTADPSTKTRGIWYRQDLDKFRMGDNAGAVYNIASEAYVDTAQKQVASIPAARTTASETLALTDAGALVRMSSGSPQTLTVPPNSTVAFPVNTVIDVAQMGAGQVTIAAGAGVTLRAKGGALKCVSQYSSATLVKIATNEWLVVGDLQT